MFAKFKPVLKWLLPVVYAVVLNMAPLAQSTAITTSPHPAAQLVCSSGGSCGDCC